MNDQGGWLSALMVVVGVVCWGVGAWTLAVLAWTTAHQRAIDTLLFYGCR
jgi:hypothetical protein